MGYLPREDVHISEPTTYVHKFRFSSYPLIVSGTDYVKDFLGVGKTSGSVSIPHHLVPRIPTFSINSIDQGWRTKPIPFSDRSASIAQEALLLAKQSGNLLTYQYPKDVVSLFGNELKRFTVALDGYLTSSNPLHSFSYLLSGLLDKNFATRLKKERLAALSRSVDASPDADDGLDEYLPTNFKELKDIGDYFNYKYWFRWEEPEPEDWKFGLMDLEDPPEEVKEFWEECFETVLPKSISEVNREEVLLSVSSSSCRTPSGLKSKVFKDKSDPKKNFFSREPLKGWRTVVYKGPTETRDCVTLPISQSNTVKWIEKQCAVICRKTKYSAYGLTDEDFKENLARFYSPGSHYYNRDLTKEGIMKPRWFIKSMANVFKKKWPDMPIWDFFSIYNKYTLNVDNKWVALPRGHGLGQANALTTLMQCGTFEFLKRVMKDDLFGEIDARFYNDDATIKCISDTAVLAYSDSESEVLQTLGLVSKLAKTYSSPIMILCEQYFPTKYGAKESYSRYLRRLPFAATNILVAKTYYHLLDDPALGQMEPDLLKECLNFWGFEHSPREYELPSWAGGWSNIKYKGVNLDFYYLNQDIDQEFCRGLSVGKPRLKPEKFQRCEGVWEHPIFGHTQLNPLSIDRRVWDLLDINQPLSKVSAKYHRSSDDHSTHKWLQKELIRRWNAWLTPAKPMTLYEIYDKVVSDNPFTDFIPPTCFLKEIPLVDAIEDSEKRPLPPYQPNKLLGALGWYSGNIWINKTINYPYLEGELTTEKVSEDQLCRFQESILSQDGVRFALPERDFVINGVFYKRNYCDDYAVLEAWVVIQGEDANLTFPIPPRRSVGGEIKYDASKYLYHLDRKGDPLYWEFWTTHGRTIPLLMMFSSLSDSDWEDIFKNVDSPDELEDLQEVISNQGSEDLEVVKDFWVWRTNGRKGEPDYLREIFIAVDNIIMNVQVHKSRFTLSADRDKEKPSEAITIGIPPKGSPMDIVYLRLTKVQPEEYYGYYIYGIPDMTDAWMGSDSEDDGGVMGDLFG